MAGEKSKRSCLAESIRHSLTFFSHLISPSDSVGVLFGETKGHEDYLTVEEALLTGDVLWGEEQLRNFNLSSGPWPGQWQKPTPTNSRTLISTISCVPQPF